MVTLTLVAEAVPLLPETNSPNTLAMLQMHHVARHALLILFLSARVATKRP